MRYASSATVLSILFAVLAGCGPSGPVRYPVSGEVTWEGEPVTKGYIVFEPADEAVAPDAGKIENGRYQTEVQEGKKKVRISAEREVGPYNPVMGSPERQSYIPREYDAETMLEVTVTPEGENQFDFHLPLKSQVGGPRAG
jgi:hypothetical protein